MAEPDWVNIPAAPLVKEPAGVAIVIVPAE